MSQHRVNTLRQACHQVAQVSSLNALLRAAAVYGLAQGDVVQHAIAQHHYTKAKPADFLQRDLEQRIADGGIKFDLLALLDRPGDPTLDATVRWPDEDSRESVRLGTITITAIEKNDPCDQSIFNPSNLAEGIGRPLDEIFAARSPAYAISLGRRRSD